MSAAPAAFRRSPATSSTPARSAWGRKPSASLPRMSRALSAASPTRAPSRPVLTASLLASPRERDHRHQCGLRRRSATAGITNSGRISAQFAGIFVGATSGATYNLSSFGGGISNSGTISASTYGIFVGAISTSTVTISTFSGGITNSGLIAAQSGVGIFVGASSHSTLRFRPSPATSAMPAPSPPDRHRDRRRCDLCRRRGDRQHGHHYRHRRHRDRSVRRDSPVSVSIAGGTVNGNMLGAGLASGNTLNFSLGAGKTFTYNNNFTNFDRSTSIPAPCCSTAPTAPPT